MHKEARRAGEIAVGAAVLPGVIEQISPGLGGAATSILGPVAGIGVMACGIGMMMKCI